VRLSSSGAFTCRGSGARLSLALDALAGPEARDTRRSAAGADRERIGRAFPEIGGEQPAAVIPVVPIVFGNEIEPPT